MHVWTRTGRALAVLVATLTAVSPAFAYTVRCESHDHRYRYCSADVSGGRVTIDRELSDSGCRYGKSWGYDDRGIWVDRGCRADFHVEERHYGSYGHYDHHGRYDDDDDRHHDKHGSKSDAAVAGAVAGAVILGALIAGAAHDGTANHDQVPSWLIGTFRGYDPSVDADVDLTVSSSGSMDARRDGKSLSGAWVGQQRIVLGGVTFDVQREGSGFRATRVGNTSAEVHYARVR